MITFAVAQPLLDLLGRNPEFFLARAAPTLDIVLVAAVLLLGLPGMLVLLVLLARAAHPTLGGVVHGLIFVVTGAALVVSVVEHTPADILPGWLEVTVGVLAGAAIWIVFLRSAGFRMIFRPAAIGPPIFAVVFLVLSPSSQFLMASGSLHRPAGVAVNNPVPVVMIVFDEFPVASLIDPGGNIPEELYPNFARLARDGVWFRNAVGVEQQTEQALPAIVTGRRPADRDAIPIAADYPLNLFSLLSDTYDIRAIESVTELCPEYACSNRSRVSAPAPTRWLALAHDLSVVSAHLLLPSDLAEGLPNIAQTWGDFANATHAARDDFDLIQRFGQNVNADRRRHVDQFIESLEEPADRPTFHFGHLLLPHIPWTYLPSGQSYPAESPAPGSTPTGWGPDEWLVMQAYQRHLLQVQYTDAIVGRIIATLERIGRYEETLLVILADHGNADIPNVDHRRVITPETVGHIAAVPLFVKLPGMEMQGVDDYRAETIDVLPTIADVLDVRVPWHVGGTSLLAASRPERTSSTMNGPKGEVTFDTSGTEKLAVAQQRTEWFGTGGPFDLAPPGYRDLLGKPLTSLRVVDDPELKVRLRHPEWYDKVDPARDPLPARVTGTISRSSPFADHVILAVGLNGRVEAVVRSYDTEGSVTRFQSMLPPEALQAGSNRVELILVEGAGPERSFHRATGS
ncbi:MAG: sulfatase-like hydrolase/transferase [Acidimicrobiia bacterium]